MDELIFDMLSTIEETVGGYDGPDRSEYELLVQRAKELGYDYVEHKEKKRLQGIEKANSIPADLDPVVKKLPDPNY